MKITDVCLGLLQIIYVMMEEDYTTVSEEFVDGYLGLMIGSQLWHPLWDPSLLHSTVDRITEELSKHLKRDRHHSVDDIKDSVRRSSIPQSPNHEVNPNLEGKLEDITARWFSVVYTPCTPS